MVIDPFSSVLLVFPQHVTSCQKQIGLTARRTQREPSDGVVSVVTRDVRSIDTVVQNDKDGKIIQTFDVDIEHVPILNHLTLPDNPAHAEICTNPVCPNKSVFRKLSERLAQLANGRPWEIELQGIP